MFGFDIKKKYKGFYAINFYNSLPNYVDFKQKQEQEQKREKYSEQEHAGGTDKLGEGEICLIYYNNKYLLSKYKNDKINKNSIKSLYVLLCGDIDIGYTFNAYYDIFDIQDVIKKQKEYNMIKLIFSNDSYYANEIISGTYYVFDNKTKEIGESNLIKINEQEHKIDGNFLICSSGERSCILECVLYKNLN